MADKTGSATLQKEAMLSKKIRTLDIQSPACLLNPDPMRQERDQALHISGKIKFRTDDGTLTW